MSSVTGGPPRLGLSLFHLVHEGLAQDPALWCLSQAGLSLREVSSGRAGFGRGWSGGAVATGLVLTVPSTLSSSGLQSSRTGTAMDRPPSLFSQGRCQRHLQPQPGATLEALAV